MNHGSLFSGIGGFDLSAEWMGWNNRFHCEWNEFGQKVLKYYWPNAESYGDITKTDFTIWRGKIDILTGGFPCQPYSSAGKRLGKEDDRHLWPEMLRAIREISPRWVVGENVRGLTNWNGGMVFDEVQADLESQGYEVTPFLLPAVAVNAPHRRDRIWFVANRDGYGQHRGYCINEKHTGERREYAQRNTFSCYIYGHATGTNNQGLEGHVPKSGKTKQPIPKARQSGIGFNNGTPNWLNFPTQSPIRFRNDGFSIKLERYITEELRNEISQTSQENRIKNLPEVWGIIQQEEIWNKIRGLYSLESKEVLLKTMQLYQTEGVEQGELSLFSEKISEPVLLHLRKYGSFGGSPRGQELAKQREKQFGNALSFLPHEVALAARRLEASITKFETWHRNESIKAAGNAIVPQVALQIFKAIQEYENKL